MVSMENAALVLEGGGMRGLYTVGVTDCLLEHGILLRDVYGVSAGACQGCNYLSGQVRRGERVWTGYLDDKRYCSVYSLIHTGDLFGADMCYNIIPNQLDPYDYEAYRRNVGTFTIVVTNCLTGQAEYFTPKDLAGNMEIVRASASLPLVSNMVMIGGVPYLDGGVADAIPLAKSISDGHGKNILVLTRQPGYRKEPDGAMKLYELKYRRYPALIEALKTRHERYNAALDLIEAEEKAGRALVIRPEAKPDVGRVEKDAAKLHALRDEGYRQPEKMIEMIRAFIQ